MNKQTQEALKMAIEWLDDYTPDEVINACKEALEQPAQEPVAWIHNENLYFKKQCKFFSKDIGQEYEGQIPLYTHPAQPLSDDEIWTILFKIKADLDGHMAHNFARAIEQAHGIGVKNE